jgi:hypothetical protein
MSEDYDYKPYPVVEKRLIENRYKKIAEDIIRNSVLINRYESWVRGNSGILLQVFNNNYVAIFKDSENI